MKKNLAVVAILYMIFSILPGIAFAENRYSIGISPNYANLGEVSPGSSHSVTFRLYSQATEPILVYMDSYGSGIDTIKAKYHDLIYNFSEESVDSWTVLIKNPVEMPAAIDDQRSTLDFSLFVNIPNDAEPGYHAIILRPSIYVPQENMGTVGSRVIGVTSFIVLFNVKGNAERNGIILDTVRSGQNVNNAEFSTYFQNTGSVTINVKAFVSAGSGKGASATENVAPEEIKILKSYVPLSRLGCTECQLDAVADYYTGNASSSSEFSMTAPIKEVQLPGKGIDITFLIIAAVIIATAIIIIRRVLNGE